MNIDSSAFQYPLLELNKPDNRGVILLLRNPTLRAMQITCHYKQVSDAYTGLLTLATNGDATASSCVNRRLDSDYFHFALCARTIKLSRMLLEKGTQSDDPFHAYLQTDKAETAITWACVRHSLILTTFMSDRDSHFALRVSCRTYGKPCRITVLNQNALLLASGMCSY